MFSNGLALRPIVVWDLIYANVIQVINLRSIRTLDRATINASVRKTDRLVTVGVGAEIWSSSSHQLIFSIYVYCFSPPPSIFPFNVFLSAVHQWLRRALSIWMHLLKGLQALMFLCHMLDDGFNGSTGQVNGFNFSWWFSYVFFI